MKICEDFNKSPKAIVSHVIDGFHQCKAAYRFWKNNKVDSKTFLEAHQKSIKNRIGSEEEYILDIQDSSELNLTSHLKTLELGPIGDGKYLQGLEMHSSLICTEKGVVLGIGSCHLWARDEINKNKGKDYRKIELKDKESFKWIRALEEVDKIEIDRGQRVTITDREGDFYELLEKCETECRQMIVRLRWDRKIEQSNKPVREFISSQVPMGEYEIKIVSRGGPQIREERTAKIEVKFSEVDFIFANTPKGKNKKLANISIIHAKEINSSEGEEPVEWFLITNLKCKDLQDAIRIVNCYAKRWLVEEFHKILKGAIKIEEARLSTGGRLEKLIILLAIFASRLLWINRLSRIQPEASCKVAFKEEEWRFVMKRIYKQDIAADSEIPKINTIVVGIAKLGGYWGRKKDPPPGIIVLWRGMMKLYEALEALNVMKM